MGTGYKWERQVDKAKQASDDPGEATKPRTGSTDKDPTRITLGLTVDAAVKYLAREIDTVDELRDANGTTRKAIRHQRGMVWRSRHMNPAEWFWLGKTRSTSLSVGRARLIVETFAIREDALFGGTT